MKTEVQAVRIICDIVLKDNLLDKLAEFGAKGFTWWEVNGKGENITHFPFNQIIPRVYIEVWCNELVAEKIFKHCSEHYKNIGMIVGISPILIHEDELTAD